MQTTSRRSVRLICLSKPVVVLIAALSLFAYGSESAWAGAIAAPLLPASAHEEAPIKFDPGVVAVLRDRARQDRVVQVIVGLPLPSGFQPEGAMGTRQAMDQRQEIADAGDRLTAALAGFDAEIYGRYASIPALAIRVDGNALQFLLESDLIDHIQLDEAVPHALGTSTGVIGAPAVWNQGFDGSGQAVAILDTGIEGSHPFFEDENGDSRIVAEVCFSNSGGAGGRVSLCPNGTPSQTGSGASEVNIQACLRNNGSQLCNHGVHVAGIAAGQSATSSGVARNADIISVQVFTRFDSGCPGDNNPCVLSYTSDQLAALNYIHTTLSQDFDVAAVNMSLGGGMNTAHCDSDSRKAAIDNLRSIGTATVIATGNNGNTNGISTPSCISTAVAVSSTTNNDLVSSFSNVHPIMDLFAPGTSIRSAVSGGGFANFNGTSMATPHVAGAWAVLKQAQPGASVDDVLAGLVDTGLPVTDQRAGGTVTKPRIRLDQALAELSPNVWSGDISNDWLDGGNWSAGGPPSCGTNATIPGTAVNMPVVGADVEVGDLTLEDGANLSMTAGTLSVCRSLEAQGDATFVMSAGTLLFTGSADASILLAGSGSQLHHLHIGNGSDDKNLQLLSPLSIAGDLQINLQAVLDANGQALSFNGGAQTLSVSGAALETVYENGFDTLDGWTVVDVNGAPTWLGSSSINAPNSPNSGPHARYTYSTTLPADDWLFSPGFTLEAGRNYTIRFNYGARSASFPERLAVYIGADNSVAAMTTQLFDNANVINTIWQEGSGVFLAPSTGTYHVGFHAYSLADQWQLAVDDLVIETPGSMRLADVHVAPGSELSLDGLLAILVEGDLNVEGSLDINGLNLAVNGSLTNHGTLIDTRDVPAAATTSILSITNEAGDGWAYRGVEITPVGVGLGATSVRIDGQQDCVPMHEDELFRRCFEIDPTVAEEAEVRFWLREDERNGQDAATSVVFRQQDGDWPGASSTDQYTNSASGPACDSVDGNQCWISAQAVTSYSRFVVGDPDFPSLPPSYSIGGTVSGLVGSGLVLQNNGGDDLAIVMDGGFNFGTPVADGGAYAVTVQNQPAGQVCTVSNGSGTVAGADVDSVLVMCVAVGDHQGLYVGSVNLAAISSNGLRSPTDPIQVNFPVAFNNVPVVIVMPGNEGTDPRSVRIRNVSPTGFELLPVTAPPGDGSGPPMTVHYLAAMPGDYRLPLVGGGDGPRVQVGTWATSTIQYNPAAFPPNVLPEDNDGNPGSACTQTPTPGWDSRSFPGADFATPPALLATIQSWNNEGANLGAQLSGPSAPFMNVALQSIGTTGFEAAIELSEVRRNVPCNGLANDETIGFVAIENNLDVLLETTGGGDPVTLVTGTGNAHRGEGGSPPSWSPSHCQDNDLGVSGSFTEANLRGFAALRSRAEADGGWLRRCSVSSPGANILRLALRIDEDAQFDAERRQTPIPATPGEIREEPVSIVIFGGDFITTPVSLAWMKVDRVSATQVRVDWATETEVGHVGFELQALSSDGHWQAVGDVIPGNGMGELGGDDYSLVVSVPANTTKLRLVDIDLYGQRRLHAPVAIGAEQGARPEAQLTDWTGIHARNAQYPISTRELPDSTSAVARVSEAGIQRVSHTDLLAAGVNLSGQPASSIAVWTGGSPQARHIGGPAVWGPDSYIEWLGQPSDSRYHASRAYRIGIDPASAVAVTAGSPIHGGAGPRVEQHSVRFEQNRRYLPTAPASDPWYDARLLSTGNPAQLNRSFELGPRAPGPVTLTVDVWGGLARSGDLPDHHVELRLNGQTIANHRFDGVVAEAIAVDIDDSLLTSINTLTVRLPADTGYPVELVQFDGFSVSFPRTSAFHEGRGQGAAGLPGQGDQLFYTAFEPGDSQRQLAFQIDQAPSGAVVWYQTEHGLARRVHDAGSLWLPGNTSAWTGAVPEQISRPLLESAVPAAEPQAADYLIISHPQFVDHLETLINLQRARDLTVAVARSDEIYAGFGHDEPVPEAIAAFIAAQATADYVLLVGGDHVDYRGYLDNGAQSFIPTFYRQADQFVRHAPDELAFVDRNGDGLPDAALGRLPVRSVDELQRLITAIVERDQAGPANRQLIASGGSGGPHERFGHNARVLGSIHGELLELNYAAVDELGTVVARQRLHLGLAGQADWLSYLGHSSPDRWGFEPLLTHAQISGITRSEAPAVISQWGCWNNWFVSPTQDAMIHGLMLGDQVKASAVLGSVSLAEDASHFALATRFYSLRAQGGLHGQSGEISTLGQALQHAQRDLITHDPAHRGAARSVVLFGDPAQPLR